MEREREQWRQTLMKQPQDASDSVASDIGDDSLPDFPEFMTDAVDGQDSNRKRHTYVSITNSNHSAHASYEHSIPQRNAPKITNYRQFYNTSYDAKSNALRQPRTNWYDNHQSTQTQNSHDTNWDYLPERTPVDDSNQQNVHGQSTRNNNRRHAGRKPILAAIFDLLCVCAVIVSVIAILGSTEFDWPFLPETSSDAELVTNVDDNDDGNGNATGANIADSTNIPTTSGAITQPTGGDSIGVDAIVENVDASGQSANAQAQAVDKPSAVANGTFQYAFEQPSYHLSLLAPECQVAYHQMLDILANHRESGTVQVSEQDDVQTVIEAVLADHPEIFWADGNGTYSINVITGTATFAPRYTMTIDEANAIRAQVESKRQTFIAELGQGIGEYDRVLRAYDAIITSMDYDLSAPHPRDVCGALVDGRGVCVAYAKGMQYLLEAAGIRCEYMTGATPDGTLHAWCLVRIDGEWSHIDPTFGDPSYVMATDGVAGDGTGSDGGGLPDVSYDYMCVTTEELLATGATIDASVAAGLPVTGNTHDWYLLNDAYVRTGDETKPGEAFDRVVASGGTAVRLKFEDVQEYAVAKAGLTDGTYLRVRFVTYQMVRGTGTRYRFVPNDAMRTICVVLEG